jgi:hypothetical protein
MAKRSKLILVTTMVCGVALICVGIAVHAALALIYPAHRVGPVDKQLVAAIKRNCVRQPCWLAPKDIVTGFEWDRMVVVELGSDRKPVEDALKVSIPQFGDLTAKLIFLNGNSVVHYADEEEDIENATDQMLAFDIPNDQNFKVYPRDAVFSVVPTEFKNGTYFALTESACMESSRQGSQNPCPPAVH